MATLAVAACSDDGESVSEAVSEQVGQALDVAAPAVDCPSDAGTSPGSEFECEATIERQVVGVTVTVSDDEELEVSVLGTTVDTDDLEAEISAEAEDILGQPVTIDCGAEEVVVIEFGGSVECEANAADGRVGVAEVTLDADGEPVLVDLRERG